VNIPPKNIDAGGYIGIREWDSSEVDASSPFDTEFHGVHYAFNGVFNWPSHISPKIQ
jgi:hypothetical protein